MNYWLKSLSRTQASTFRTAGCFAWFFVLPICGYSDTPSKVEVFKTYLESRPPVTSVLFKQQSLARPNFAPVSSDDEQLYEGAWQMDGFYLRRHWNFDTTGSLVGAATFTAGLIFAGSKPGVFWHIVNTNLYYTASDSTNHDDFVRDTSKNAAAILFSTLNLGVEALAPGTLRWQANTFTGMSEFGSTLHGELVESNNAPVHLSVFYEGRDYHYVTEYSYLESSKMVSYGIPSVFKTSFIRGSQVIPQKIIRFVAVELAKTNQPTTFFSPERFFATDYQRIAFTNGSLHVVHATGLMEPLRGARPAGTSAEKRRLAVFAVLAASSLSLILFLFLVNRERRKQIQQTRRI